jgi:hypothetical protein
MILIRLAQSMEGVPCQFICLVLRVLTTFPANPFVPLFVAGWVDNQCAPINIYKCIDMFYFKSYNILSNDILLQTLLCHCLLQVGLTLIMHLQPQPPADHAAARKRQSPKLYSLPGQGRGHQIYPGSVTEADMVSAGVWFCLCVSKESC